MLFIEIMFGSAEHLICSSGACAGGTYQSFNSSEPCFREVSYRSVRYVPGPS